MKKQDKIDNDLSFLDEKFSEKLTYKMLLVFGFVPCTLESKETLYYFLNLTQPLRIVFVKKIYEYMKKNPKVILPNYTFINELRLGIK